MTVHLMKIRHHMVKRFAQERDCCCSKIQLRQLCHPVSARAAEDVCLVGAFRSATREATQKLRARRSRLAQRLLNLDPKAEGHVLPVTADPRHAPRCPCLKITPPPLQSEPTFGATLLSLCGVNFRRYLRAWSRLRHFPGQPHRKTSAAKHVYPAHGTCYRHRC